jgi:exopolysaccharide production protein ExoZ
VGTSSHELASVQLLRAAAALAVAVWHLSWVGRAFPGALPAAPPFLAFGYAGVDLFFVISGFIICHITHGRPFAPARFAARRFFRIVPLYALFTALALLALLLNPVWDGKGILDAGYVVRSLLIVPMREAPYLGVGWSLEHELLFYGLAGGLLALGRPRALPFALAGLFGVGVVLHVLLPERSGRQVWDHHLFSLYHFQFLVGVLVFHGRAQLAALGWELPLALGVGGFLLTSHFVATHQLALDPLLQVPTQPMGWLGLARALGYGVSSGLLLLGMLEAERSGAFQSRPGAGGAGRQLLVLIGEASYVLYLCHYFVYSILAKVYASLGLPPDLALPALLAALAAAIGFAIACHLALERPLLRAVRRRF